MYTPNGFSLTIFKDRYAFTTEETWEEAAGRLARQMALAETPDKQKIYEEKFYDVIVNNLFVPGGRIWYNSGRNNPQLLNCFVLSNELDSKQGWGNISKEMIISSMTGGGNGIDFSDVRPNGAPIAGQRGECPGPVSLMKLINNNAPPIKAGGQRRVALMFSLDLDHPDINTFLDAKLEKGELQYANVSVRSKNTSDFIKAVKKDLDWELSWKGKFKNKIKAKDVWDKIVKNAYESAEPGFLNWELALSESNIYYIEDLVTTNPCVIGTTEILTRNGYEEIQNLVDKEIDIWNGFEWSKVVPKITGYNQPTVTITFSDGRNLTCTEYHKFHIIKNYSGDKEIIEAKNLQPGMKLIKHEFPVIDGELDLKNAYTQGFVSAEGMDNYNYVWIYEPKKVCLNRLQENCKYYKEGYKKGITLYFKEPMLSKSFVPLNYNIKSKIDWLSGLFDGDGTELKEGGLQLGSVDLRFLKDVQKLLSTLGIQSKVVPMNKAGEKLMPDGYGGSKSFYCQESFRICIGAKQMQVLKELGLKCERLLFNKTPQRDASQFITIVDITESKIEEKVYCFNEPKRHLGIFNGIITGQCGEIAMSSYDCCCLGHVVLSRFIENGEMNWHHLANTVRIGVRFLDNVLTVNNFPLPEMKEKSNKLRRIGLGTTALADTLVLLGYKYGSEEGNKFIDKLFRFISKVAYETSVMLAVEKGMFPACNPEKHIESGFMRRMPAKIKELVKEHGIRNCAILTQAPTGTVSLLSGNCSSGIEPMFAPAYERRYWDKDVRKTELVFHPLFAQFMKEGKSVEHFVSAHELSVKDHMEVQKIIQKHIDNAVSKTINIPYDYPLEDVAQLWLDYLPYLKGTTFYRENTRGYYNEVTSQIEEPPLKAINLEEAKNRFTEQHKTDIINIDDCPDGICDIK